MLRDPWYRKFNVRVCLPLETTGHDEKCGRSIQFPSVLIQTSGLSCVLLFFGPFPVGL